MAILGLSDIFWRDNPFIRGAIGIVICGVASFSLHRLLSFILGSTLGAFLFTMIFITNYAGMEMVLWRHITPYLLSLSFFFLGLCEIFKMKRFYSFSINKKAIILIFIATLFHEMITLCILLLVSVVFLFWQFNKPNNHSKYLYSIISTLIFPVILFLVLNIADFFYYQAPGVLGPSDNATQISVDRLFKSIWIPLSAASNTFFFPNTINIGRGYFFSWRFELNDFWFNFSGLITYTVLLFLLFQNIRELFFRNFSARTIVELGVILNFLAVIFSLGIGRVLLRSHEYLYRATYYYSITTFLLCTIIAILISKLHQNNRFFILRIILWGAIITFCFTIISVNYSKLNTALTESSSKDFSWAYQHTNLANSLQKNEKYCLLGIEPSSQKKIISKVSMLLFTPKYYCHAKDTREGAYLQVYQNHIWLSKIKSDGIKNQKVQEDKKVNLTIYKSIAPPNKEQIVSINHSVDFGGGANFILSTNVYNNPELSLKFYLHNHRGIVLGYKDNQNFLLFVIRDFAIYAYRMESGILSHTINEIPIPFTKKDEANIIQIRKLGNNLILFFNNYLITSIPNVGNWIGHVGLYSHVKEQFLKEFSDFVVLSRYNHNPEISFMPIIKLIEWQ
ncbi:MAG: hypothetical protein H7A23_17845 [Leptospiraceae bacterium]|nr:hypothetical protein [Leptospiraceae bacterium]